MTMDFRRFMENKPAILQAYPGVIDLTETNIVAALGHHRPVINDLPLKAHRCHLAEFWLDAFGLARSLKPQALISQGVRHSLSLLFAGYAKQAITVAVPSDVYPVYLSLAHDAGLDISTYPAFAPLGDTVFGDAQVVLLTNPVKPWGRWLSETELVLLNQWLQADSRRRIIIDAVYTWETRFNSLTMSLFASGQTIVLHSLSKGWLQPLVLGVALIPEQDVEYWTPIFRAAPPTADNLCLAQVLLTRHSAFPATLPAILAQEEARMRLLVADKGVQIASQGNADVRYHFIVETSWRELLTASGVLALPASVFGYPSEDISIVTSLTPSKR